MDIVHVAAETAPWSKTGGLGDVAGSLPKALAKRGHRVMAVSPRYKPIEGAEDTGIRGRVHLFGQEHEFALLALDRDGVRWVFVDNPCFRREGIYGSSEGAYTDNLFRYALLTRAALEAAVRLPLPGGPVGDDAVFHANDWHTALLPAYVQAIYKPAGRFRRSGTVLALHNCGHHGSAAADQFAGLDLPPRYWPVCDMAGRLNPLKAGIVSADRLVTVSPTYAREITRDQGFGLEGLLAGRGRHLTGILNGIDSDWDPATDKHLPANYDRSDLRGKAICKATLQAELGLPVRPEVPLLGLVARLSHQKGIDLVEEIAPWLGHLDVQVVMLGSGSERYEQFFRDCERRWPKKMRGWVGFSEKLAHRIEAGADIFLMPSRFEPCGLNQMYSLRYGTVPIVHRTGGLADTVETFDPSRDTGTGWAFAPLEAWRFQRAVELALITFKGFPDTWKRIQGRGMALDLTWDRSAARYEALYEAARG